MPLFAPDTLARWTGGSWTARPVLPLTGFSFDTRTLRPGDVFVALRTEKRDGHDFLEDARRAGAGAALVSRAISGSPLAQLCVADPLRAFHEVAREHRRTFRGPVIGISGSAGKTSTKDLLALLLGGTAGGVVATEGNLNNHLGVPLTLTRLDPPRTNYAVIETGISAPGEMRTLAGMIEPDVAIITLIAPAHTEELGGLAGVAREKAVLPAAVKPDGLAIFTAETAAFSPFAGLSVPTCVVERVAVLDGAPGAGRVRYITRSTRTETHLELAGPAGARTTLQFRRVSDGMAANVALAVTAARRLGVTADRIQERIRAWQPAALRGEVRDLDGRLLYLDCYNANPASMADALASFAALAPADRPRLYVLGCMEELGDEAPRHHRALGQSLALGPNDRAFVIGTFASEVRAGFLEKGGAETQIEVVSSLEPVTSVLASWPGPVFVKGSRRYQLERVIGQEAGHSLPC